MAPQQGGGVERQVRVLQGPRTPTWGCSCGKNDNWASRITCSCGRSAPRRVVADAQRADQDFRAKGGQRLPARAGAATGLVRKPAPWSSDYDGGLEKRHGSEKKEKLTHLVAAATGAKSDGGSARGGPGRRGEPTSERRRSGREVPRAAWLRDCATTLPTACEHPHDLPDAEDPTTCSGPASKPYGVRC